MQDYYIMQKMLLVTTRVDWASENQPLIQILGKTGEQNIGNDLF